MANYYISSARKSPTGTITALKVHQVNPDGSFDPTKFTSVTHDDVARSILANNSYTTIVLKVANGKAEWFTGAKVEVLLRTDQNSSTKDNLDSLPAF